MLEHADKIQQAFDKAASTYDEHAKLQVHAGSHLISYLPQREYHHGIDLGCGTGAVTRELVNTCKFADLYAVDTSIMSLAIARQRFTEENIFINSANFDVSLPGTQLFDLAFANMSLHWSLNFNKSLKRIDKRLAQNGVFAFSIPLADTFNELTPHFAVNHFLTADEVATTFDTLKSNLMLVKQETIAMTFPDTLSALRYIKRIGAHHVTTPRYAGLSGKNAVTATEITTLTYQIGYFVARLES